MRPTDPLASRMRRVKRTGVRRRPLDDLYHQLVSASWWRLFALVVALYVGTNLAFACGYLALGDEIEGARPGSLHDAFFFSVQTLATIGYGKWLPRGTGAHALVAAEALVGMLGFAFATGLVFAKFARPTARVLWSQVAVVAPRDGVPSLMFRAANERGNQIAEAQVRVVLARDEITVEGERVRRFHDLRLARQHNAFFALTWTIVHPIDEASPLAGLDAASLAEQGAQIIVSLVGLDDTLAQTIHARHAYDASQVVWGARFVDILERDGGATTIHLERFHDTEPL